MERYRCGRSLVCAALFACILLGQGVTRAADDSWTLESKDGTNWLKFGFLAQMRAEGADNDAFDGTSKDLYFRRLRLLMGGSLGGKWNLFLETDSPDLGKGLPNGEKVSGDLLMLDFVVNYTHSPGFKIDAGLILVPFSHNGLQSAAGLMPMDYGIFSFLESVATTSRVGRDYGFEVWGHVLNQKLEYRAAVLDGYRGDNSTNDLRTTGRLVYYFFEPETGRFYQGTSLGQKHILALGTSYDMQEDYEAYDVDLYWDQPFGSDPKSRSALTLQGMVSHLDGGGFIDIPEQDVVYAEGGFWIPGIKVQPYVSYGSRDFDNPASVDETYYEAGLGWYLRRFNLVTKLSYQMLDRDGGDDITRVILQLQAFKF